MGAVDETRHEAQDLLGKAKEKIGDATGNHHLQAEGLADQGKAKLGKAGDDVRDVLRGRDDDAGRHDQDDPNT